MNSSRSNIPGVKATDVALAVAQHVADSNPHPQYMTPLETRGFISGQSVISVSGSADVSLTFSEINAGFLSFAGSLSAPINAILPGGGSWSVYNATAQTITLKHAGFAGYAVAAGERKLLWSDGANVFPQDNERGLEGKIDRTTTQQSISYGPGYKVDFQNNGNFVIYGDDSAPMFAVGGNGFTAQFKASLLLGVNSTYTALKVNGTPGNSQEVIYTKNFLSRWAMSSNGETESGGNSGSNFGIFAFDDAGNYIGAAVTISRATRGMEVASTLSVGDRVFANKGLSVNDVTNADSSAVSVSKTYTNPPSTSSLPSAIRAIFYDDARANYLSIQAMRFEYQRTAAATGMPGAFNSSFVLNSSFASPMSSAFASMTIEGPYNPSGFLIGSYTAIRITPPTGGLGGGVLTGFRLDTGAGGIEAATTAVNGDLLSIGGSSSLYGPVRIGSYTLSTLPSAAAYAGYNIVVSNANGGAKTCYSDGTDWKILNTTTTVS